LDEQIGLGPETAEQKESREAADAIRQSRAARLGLPPPPPCPVIRHDHRRARRSAAEVIKEARARRREQVAL
jgi:hypothetical protein